jgi:tRNA(fMet)-specific endonuclease VapC
MGTLIDSSILIAAERGALELERLPVRSADADLAISSITASELLHGVHRASNKSQRVRREAFVEALLQALPVLPFDLRAARIHARLWAEFAAAGLVIGAYDLMIGATALCGGFSLATRDKRSFSKIPGLKVVYW